MPIKYDQAKFNNSKVTIVFPTSGDNGPLNFIRRIEFFFDESIMDYTLYFIGVKKENNCPTVKFDESGKMQFVKEENNSPGEKELFKLLKDVFGNIDDLRLQEEDAFSEWKIRCHTLGFNGIVNILILFALAEIIPPLPELQKGLLGVKAQVEKYAAFYSKDQRIQAQDMITKLPYVEVIGMDARDLLKAECLLRLIGQIQNLSLFPEDREKGTQLKQKFELELAKVFGTPVPSAQTSIPLAKPATTSTPAQPPTKTSLASSSTVITSSLREATSTLPKKETAATKPTSPTIPATSSPQIQPSAKTNTSPNSTAITRPLRQTTSVPQTEAPAVKAIKPTATTPSANATKLSEPKKTNYQIKQKTAEGIIFTHNPSKDNPLKFISEVIISPKMIILTGAEKELTELTQLFKENCFEKNWTIQTFPIDGKQRLICSTTDIYGFKCLLNSLAKFGLAPQKNEFKGQMVGSFTWEELFIENHNMVTSQLSSWAQEKSTLPSESRPNQASLH